MKKKHFKLDPNILIIIFLGALITAKCIDVFSKKSINIPNPITTFYSPRYDTPLLEGKTNLIHKFPSPNNMRIAYDCIIADPPTVHKFLTILKPNEKINPRVPTYLDGLYVLGWEGNDTLTVLQAHLPAEQEKVIPFESFNTKEKIGNVYLKTRHRYLKRFMFHDFRFNLLTFQNDSVYFQKIDDSGVIRGRLGFLKGEVKIPENSDSLSTINAVKYPEIYIPTSGQKGYPEAIITHYTLTAESAWLTSLFKNQSFCFVVDTAAYN